jgi:PAS domain S-box-containing protein
MKGMDVIIPEDLRRRHWEGFNRAIAEGHTRIGSRAMPTRALHKNGSRLYVALSFAVVKDPSGAAVGAMAAGRNITEQHLSDKALRKRLAELEQKQRDLSGPSR